MDHRRKKMKNALTTIALLALLVPVHADEFHLVDRCVSNFTFVHFGIRELA